MSPLTRPHDPRVKLLLSYDIIPETQQAYYEFIMREFIPRLQAMGLALIEAWHTAYGNYPLRLTAFVAPDRETLDNILSSNEWGELDQQFKQVVTNLERKVIPYQEGFQF